MGYHDARGCRSRPAALADSPTPVVRSQSSFHRVRRSPIPQGADRENSTPPPYRRIRLSGLRAEADPRERVADRRADVLQVCRDPLQVAEQHHQAEDPALDRVVRAAGLHDRLQQAVRVARDPAVELDVVPGGGRVALLEGGARPREHLTGPLHHAHVTVFVVPELQAPRNEADQLTDVLHEVADPLEVDDHARQHETRQEVLALRHRQVLEDLPAHVDLALVQDLVLLKPLSVPRWLENSLRVFAYLYLALAVLFAATSAGPSLFRALAQLLPSPGISTLSST